MITKDPALLVRQNGPFTLDKKHTHIWPLSSAGNSVILQSKDSVVVTCVLMNTWCPGGRSNFQPWSRSSFVFLVNKCQVVLPQLKKSWTVLFYIFVSLVSCKTFIGDPLWLACVYFYLNIQKWPIPSFQFTFVSPHQQKKKKKTFVVSRWLNKHTCARSHTCTWLHNALCYSAINMYKRDIIFSLLATWKL